MSTVLGSPPNLTDLFKLLLIKITILTAIMIKITIIDIRNFYYYIMVTYLNRYILGEE